MNKSLLLEVFSTDGNAQRIECDYVRLPVAQESSGKFSGSCGIKKGHAKAAISLDDGILSADLNGESVFKAEISGGFAIVENNTVTVTVEKIRI